MSGKAIWDFWAGRYEKLWVQKYSLAPTRKKILEMIQPILQKNINSAEPVIILDFGCGTGQLLIEIARANPTAKLKLYGADFSPQMIKEAEKNAREHSLSIHFEVLDVSEIDSFQQRFDLILCTHSLPYYKDQRKAIRDMTGLLKEDGKLILAHASANNFYDKIALSLVKLTTGFAKYPSLKQLEEIQDENVRLIQTEPLQTIGIMPTILISTFAKQTALQILLIRPHPPKETIGLQHVMICEPLELEYLVGNLPQGAEARIVDMIIEKKNLQYFIHKYQPDIVGITGYITHVGIIKEYAKTIKNMLPHAITVVGGVHAEVVPEDFLDQNIDYIINADPISTFNRIVEHSLSVSPKSATWGDYTPVTSIPGTYVKGCPQTKTPEFHYKHPDRSAVSKYRSAYYYMFHNPCALIKTSFGCPYNCSFCFCKEITGRKYFARDIQEVILELQSIPEKEIYIVDDDFLFDPERLSGFCDLLQQENMDKRFLVYGRADFIANHEPLIKRLAQNGLSAVIVGIESVRSRDLVDFNKKTTLETNMKAVEILKKYDIELYATMILHLDYTKEDFRQLERWIQSMDITFVNLQPLTPLPGTDIFDDYKDRILVDRQDYPKWDLAHIVLTPENMSIRAYYYQIIRLYGRIVLAPKNISRMIKKYGWGPVLKLFIGSSRVSLQYWKKMIKGK